VAPQPLHRGAGRAQQLLAVELDAAGDLRGLRVVQAEHGQVRHRLAGAGLAHDAQGAAPFDLEGEPVHGVHDAVLGVEVDGEVVDFEKHQLSLTRGSMTAYRESTTTFITTIAAAASSTVAISVGRSE